MPEAQRPEVPTSQAALSRGVARQRTATGSSQAGASPRARVLTALVGIPLVALVVWRGGGVLIGVALVLALIGMRELIVASRRVAPIVIELAYPLLLLVFAALLRAGALWSRPGEEPSPLRALAPALALCAVPLLLLAWAVWRYPTRERVSLASVALSVLAVFYVASFAFLPLLHGTARGAALMWLLLPGVWAGDTAAYYAGRAWGRVRLTPLSPGKSREGTLAGWVATLAVCGAIAVLTGLGWGHGLALGALIGLAAPLGDLAESFWKRELGVKDLGNLLPGHGGVLDRCDSLLFAAPAAYLYALWRIA